MRNFISYKAGCHTSALYFLIPAFNKDVSFLTDRERRKARSITPTRNICRLHSHTLTQIHHSHCTPPQPPAQRRLHTTAIHQLYEAGSDTNGSICPFAESGSGVRASCLAGELSRLRCLAPFPPLSPALKRPTAALFLFLFCHRYHSIMFSP